MLLAEDLRLADQVRNLEVLIEGTGCKQRRLPVVICAHRQNLIRERKRKKGKSICRPLMHRCRFGTKVCSTVQCGVELLYSTRGTRGRERL